MTDLVELSAVELRRRIGTKDISPVELLEACIARIEAINPAVNAVTATCYERAHDEARRAEAAVLAGDALPPLHGLPVGIKDLQDTEGLRTTYGSPLYKDFVPTKDESQVARVRAAGGIVVGKTNVPEWGAGANTRNPVWGATGNPFDPMLNAGGSSGGSAVALATDMLPLCSGSDTGGSLRIPAAKCGVVGFRPSPGLVPTDKRAFGWAPISVVGPMGRTVADTCLLLSAQAASEGGDPLSYPVDPATFAVPQHVDLGRMRVAVTADLGGAPVADDIRAVFDAKVASMRGLFRECTVIAPDFTGADDVFDVVRAVSYVGRYQAAYQKDPMSLGPNVRANYEMGARMSLADFSLAHVQQTRIFRAFQDVFRDYDAVLAPVTPVSPFPWSQPYLDTLDGTKLRNYYHWLALTYFITLTGHPALAMPCGRDHKGMPFGLQVIGPHRGDRFVLGLGHALELAFADRPALARPRPDLARLSAPVPELRAMISV